LSQSFITAIAYGEGAAVLAVGAIAGILGLVNIFARKNLELAYLFLGALSTFEALWVLYRLKEKGIGGEHIGPAPYLIIAGGAGLVIVGILGAIAHASRAADADNLPRRRIKRD
jgi:hypothetical protein